MMLASCEQALRLTIPAVRIAVAKTLADHGMQQKEIANALGVVQPAVSKYLNHKYSSKVAKIEQLVKGEGLEKAVAEMALNHKSKAEISKNIDRTASRDILVRFALGL